MNTSYASFATLLLTAVWALSAGYAHPVHAQETHGLSPRSIEHTTPPGSIISETITITNSYPYVLNVFPSLHGIEVLPDGTEVVVPGSETPMIDWLSMTRAVQRLQPGASTSIAVTFTVDRAAVPGEYRALLGFGQGLDRPTAERAVERGTAPAVVVRFVVPEPRVDSGAAASFKMTQFLFSQSQAGVYYAIHNPSQKTIVPVGELIFYNNRGLEVAAVAVNPERTPIEPGDVLSIATTTPQLPGVGLYDVQARFDFGINQLTNVSLQDSFWYIPWYILLILCTIVLGMGIVVYRRASRSTVRHTSTDNAAAHLPLHIYQGESPAEDHDINLKS